MTEASIIRNRSVEALSMRGITKQFGTLKAVDSVDFSVKAGMVHALVGENGAGKSTLMNCLFGLVQPDEGEIWISGRRASIQSPRDALRQGIGMVHQHFKLVPSLTVAENVFLGREKTRFGFVNKLANERAVNGLANEYGLTLSPSDVVSNLSVGAQQRVEILRALSQNVTALVLDEPTAVLTPSETDRFLETVRGFAERGLAVVLISHHLEEVLKVADEVTVLRRGRKVAHHTVAAVNAKILASLIVGEQIEQLSEVPSGNPGKIAMEVRNLSVHNRFGKTVVDDLSFDVRRGEILGVLGIAGNGQTELVEAVTRLRTPTAGTVRIDSVEMTSVASAREAGLAHIPEDRIGRGMAGYWTVENNIAVGFLRGHRIGRSVVSNRKKQRLVNDLIKDFDVRISSKEEQARRLSGGNAQKMVLARELSQDPEIIVCAEPTRGLDLAATDFVLRKLVAMRDRGGAVVLFSSELSAVVAVADRTLVIYQGRIVREFANRPPEAEVGRAMLGQTA